MHVEASVKRIEGALENAYDEVFALEYPARRIEEDVEECELNVGEWQPVAAIESLTRENVEGETGGVLDSRNIRVPVRHAMFGTAKDSVDASDELTGVEGLGKVVVRSFVEAGDAIRLAALGAEEQNAEMGELPEPSEYLEAIHAGKHHVEQNHVVGVGAENGETCLSMMLGIEFNIVRREVIAEHCAELDIIINNQNRCHMSPALEKNQL